MKSYFIHFICNPVMFVKVQVVSSLTRVTWFATEVILGYPCYYTGGEGGGNKYFSLSTQIVLSETNLFIQYDLAFLITL